jgi:hypothetical protein
MIAGYETSEARMKLADFGSFRSAFSKNDLGGEIILLLQRCPIYETSEVYLYYNLTSLKTRKNFIGKWLEIPAWLLKNGVGQT